MDKIALLSIIILTIALPVLSGDAQSLDRSHAQLRTRFIIASTIYAAYIIYIRPRLAAL